METKTLDNLKDLHSKLEVVFKAENEAIKTKQKDVLSEQLKLQVNLIYDFVKENNLILVELNTAWVEKNEARRTIYNPKTLEHKSFKNLSDKDFVNKFNKGKNNCLFVHSTFWGMDYMLIM